MDIVLTVLEIVAPVFILGCIGFAWVKLGFEYRLAFVTKLSMTLGVPCLIFISLVETEIDPNALTQILLASAVAYGAITIAFFVIVKLLKLETRSFLPPLIFGNTGNVGLPLALFAFGSEGLGFAIVVFAAMAIWSFTYGVWVVSGGGSIMRVLKEPMVAATLLGALFMWQDWDVPTFLGNSLNLVGQMAIPLMLLTLGVAVARLQPGRMAQAVWLSLLKAAICIGIAAVVGRWFNLPPVAYAVLVLQVGTPVAVTSYMLAEKYGADSDAVAGLVVASTLLSVAIFPLALFFLI
ncbi:MULTISPECIES: AEC family transporter [Halocynthiibacter]|uniref:AEC family transporter n=1 Tax=Halocynthiibacter halioticoli TaxID=2986804 RepID=A0AAE3LRL5_9RHOB|nr:MULTISPECIES: AEC family transporter [Halocynthiibacter]MCV6825717.1 AEC family transporter [Halocynthiibacter halioticoli]MCW4058718.1 AEC family transporter [Halocynthiibacter sp. SDUM655004]MDE0591091.1 AEC family transporter [Halocynthiibacter sp. C4]